MVKELLVTIGHSVIALEWSKPRFLPSKYTLTYSCSLRSTGRVYLQKKVELDKVSTVTMLENIEPDSQCRIKLKANYNPAMLDSGISQYVVYPTEGNSDWICGI